MRNGVSPGLRAIAWLSLGLLVTVVPGCDGDPVQPPTGIRLDLESCVAADDAPESCRGRLVSAAAAGGCLIVVPGGDTSRTQTLALTWQDTRLTPADPGSSLNLAAGEAFEASLFTLSAATDCGGLDLRAPCTAAGGCIARFGPVGQSVAAGDATRIDFLVDGACQMEQAPSAADRFVEMCGDGVDNDCDTAVDESLSGPCFVGVGACRREGNAQLCREGGYACDAVPGSPEADVDCDGVDDDCDELIDEDGGCDACLFDNECLRTPATPQCVDGRCVACDPASGDGCGADTPICDPATSTCRGCAADRECSDGRFCIAGSCLGCNPDPNSETCPDPDEPACDAETFTCRACRDGSECLSGICFSGRCAPCDPTNNAGCFGETNICDRNDLSCRTCSVDAECAAISDEEPVCSDGECVECDVVSNAGCGEPAQPICVVDPAGTPARCAPCADDDECSAGSSCRNGRCVGCDPIDNSGCEALGAQPICDDSEDEDNAFCRPCRNDLECPGGLGRGICSAGFCRECNDADARGCDEAGVAPICVNGQCRLCGGDGECALRPGRLDLCVDNRCALCDEASNRGCEGATPVCRNGACRACAADAECGGGLQCVGGQCTVCDPADNAGCGDATPICNPRGAVCEPCRDDGQCEGDELCVAGRCVECEPGNNRGCDAEGRSPICAPQTATCTGCGIDDDCAGRQCLDSGRCAECDPLDNAGCDGLGAEPICNVDGTCRRCAADIDCAGRGLDPVCDLAAGVCRVCSSIGNRGCDPTGQAPICEGSRVCRGCLVDDECGEGLLCDGGRCQGCSEQDNTGCVADGAEPICVGGTCQPCNADAQCVNPQLSFCVIGRCKACDPGNDDGCEPESDRPFCLAGECTPCTDINRACAELDAGRPECLNDGRCGPCNPQGNVGCVAEGIAPVCDATSLLCRSCITDDECNLGNCDLAAGGRCVTCDAGEAETGCDLTGGRPVCDDQTRRCEPCANDGECTGNPQGEQCRDGACGCSDRDDCAADPGRPICAAATSNTCRACNNNGECGMGFRCRQGQCQAQ